MRPGARTVVCRRIRINNGGFIDLLDAHSIPRTRSATPRFRAHYERNGGWLQLGSISHFEWNRIEIVLERLPAALEGLRIVHLSDLHVRPAWYPAYDLLIQRLGQDPPDLILITGDFVEHRPDHRKVLPTLQRFLTQLRSRLGIYGILGNHDGDLLAARLAAWGIQPICRRIVRLQADDASIELVGVPGVMRRDLDERFASQIPAAEPGVPRIAMAHFPDSITALGGLQADVVLAGHTHGGQVCLPGRIPIITHDSLPRAMCSGVHEVGGTLLIVSRGMGFATLPLRVFCPPEVIELRLLSVKT